MSVSSDSLASVTRPGSGKDRSLIGILQADWKTMYHHEESKDVTIVIGEEESFRVHSLVLVARCHKLSGRLDHSQNDNTLVFKHLSVNAVKRILQYLYSAEVSLAIFFFVTV